MFADKTLVPVEKSIEEIRQTLQKVKAEGFFLGALEGDSYIGFYFEGKPVKMMFSIPLHPGEAATIAQVKKYEQLRRTHWRQVLLCLKSKFASILYGIETFDQAFMAHILPKNEAINDSPAITQTPNQNLEFKAKKPKAA